MGNFFLTVNFNSDYNDDLNIVHFNADLKLINLKTEDEICIGHAGFLLFNTYLFDGWYDVVESADGVSGDTFEVFNVLTPYIEEEEIQGKVVILNSFEILEGYRNHGWGANAMEEFIKYWSYIGIDYLALKPAPIKDNIKDDERVRYIERLSKFYSKFGFKLLYKSGLLEPCMGRNLNYII